MFIQNFYYSNCFVPYFLATHVAGTETIMSGQSSTFDPFDAGRFQCCRACVLVCFFMLSHDINGNKYNRNWCLFNLNEQPTALLQVSLTFPKLVSSHINHYYQRQSLCYVTRIIQSP